MEVKICLFMIPFIHFCMGIKLCMKEIQEVDQGSTIGVGF